MIARTLIFGIFMIGAIVGVWAIMQPLVWNVIEHSEQSTITAGANTTGGAQVFAVLRYVNDLWAIPLILGVLLWMVIYAQREDWRGHYE